MGQKSSLTESSVKMKESAYRLLSTPSATFLQSTLQSWGFLAPPQRQSIRAQREHTERRIAGTLVTLLSPILYRRRPRNSGKDGLVRNGLVSIGSDRCRPCARLLCKHR